MQKLKITDVIIIAIITIFALFCILPILLITIVSFTDEAAIIADGYSFFPKAWSLEAYRMVFVENPMLVRSYLISIFVTVVGTISAVAITFMAAYTLANPQIRYRNRLALFFFITMVFSTGLVPWYMITDALGIRNTILALIIPSLLFNPFNLFLVRNFLNGIPHALMESAKIDGAGDTYIAFRIYLPLAMPVLATITLFYGLGYWNNWFNAIMLVDKTKLYPLQFMLYKLQSEINMISQMGSAYAEAGKTMPAESFKMAVAVITIGPIVLLYPYLQRFFIKGLIIGSVKG